MLTYFLLISAYFFNLQRFLNKLNFMGLRRAFQCLKSPFHFYNCYHLVKIVCNFLKIAVDFSQMEVAFYKPKVLLPFNRDKEGDSYREFPI